MTGIKPPPPKRKLALEPLTVSVKPKPLTKKEDGGNVLLNFSVTPEFKRKLKTYAASKDLSMVDVLKAAIDDYIEKDGE